MADIYGRSGGPFLDQIQAEHQEITSAAAENRTPDFSRENLVPLQADDPAPHLPGSPVIPAVAPQQAAVTGLGQPPTPAISMRLLELDFNSVEAVTAVRDQLTQWIDAALLPGDTTPTSLLPGTVTPTAGTNTPTTGPGTTPVTTPVTPGPAPDPVPVQAPAADTTAPAATPAPVVVPDQSPVADATAYPYQDANGTWISAPRTDPATDPGQPPVAENPDGTEPVDPTPDSAPSNLPTDFPAPAAPVTDQPAPGAAGPAQPDWVSDVLRTSDPAAVASIAALAGPDPTQNQVTP